jgi:hypothetical protein
VNTGLANVSDAGANYLPGVLREEVPMGGDEDAGTVHTEKLDVN